MSLERQRELVEEDIKGYAGARPLALGVCPAVKIECSLWIGLQNGFCATDVGRFVYIHAPVLCSEREDVGTARMGTPIPSPSSYAPRALGRRTRNTSNTADGAVSQPGVASGDGGAGRRLGNIGHAVGGGGDDPGVGRCLAGDRLDDDGGGVRPGGLWKRLREIAGVAGADDERAVDV